MFTAFPILSSVCKCTEQSGSCIINEFINPMKAWRITGLPKLDGVQLDTVEAIIICLKNAAGFSWRMANNLLT